MVEGDWCTGGTSPIGFSTARGGGILTVRGDGGGPFMVRFKSDVPSPDIMASLQSPPRTAGTAGPTNNLPGRSGVGNSQLSVHMRGIHEGHRMNSVSALEFEVERLGVEDRRSARV